MCLPLRSSWLTVEGGRQIGRRRSAASPGRTGSLGRLGRRGCWRFQTSRVLMARSALRGFRSPGERHSVERRTGPPVLVQTGRDRRRVRRCCSAGECERLGGASSDADAPVPTGERRPARIALLHFGDAALCAQASACKPNPEAWPRRSGVLVCIRSDVDRPGRRDCYLGECERLGLGLSGAEGVQRSAVLRSVGGGCIIGMRGGCRCGSGASRRICK